MVSFNSLLATLSLALSVSAIPAEISTRDTCPGAGQVAAGMKWYPGNVQNCQGNPFDNKPAFVPQIGGPTHEYYVGQCYPKGDYGSVFIDTLRETCSYEEHTAADCSDKGTSFSTGSTCYLGPKLFPNYFRVTCTCIH